MNRMFVYVLLPLLLAPQWAGAGKTTIPGVRIESFKSIADMDGDWKLQIVLTPEVQYVVTGCDKSEYDKNRQFTYWTGSAGQIPMAQMLQAQAAYADAQGRTVDITYDNSTCNNADGFMLIGIKVNPN